MLDLNAIPNPPNSPIEKLLAESMLDNPQPQLRAMLSDNPTKEEILKAFAYMDDKVASYVRGHNRILEQWANIHTHPGLGLAPGSSGDPVILLAIAGQSTNVLPFNLTTGVLGSAVGTAAGPIGTLASDTSLSRFAMASTGASGRTETRDEGNVLLDIMGITAKPRLVQESTDGHVFAMDYAGTVSIMDPTGTMVLTDFVPGGAGREGAIMPDRSLWFRSTGVTGKFESRNLAGTLVTSYAQTSAWAWGGGALDATNSRLLAAINARSGVSLFDVDTGTQQWINTARYAVGAVGTSPCIDEESDCVWAIAGGTPPTLVRLDLGSGVEISNLPLTGHTMHAQTDMALGKVRMFGSFGIGRSGSHLFRFQVDPLSLIWQTPIATAAGGFAVIRG